MKIAIISDIHGNLEALKATLKDIEKRKVDNVHFSTEHKNIDEMNEQEQKRIKWCNIWSYSSSIYG